MWHRDPLICFRKGGHEKCSSFAHFCTVKHWTELHQQLCTLFSHILLSSWCHQVTRHRSRTSDSGAQGPAFATLVNSPKLPSQSPCLLQLIKWKEWCWSLLAPRVKKFGTCSSNAQRWNNIILHNLNSHESAPAANSTTPKQLKLLTIFISLQHQLAKCILQHSHNEKMYFSVLINKMHHLPL